MERYPESGLSEYFPNVRPVTMETRKKSPCCLRPLLLLQPKGASLSFISQNGCMSPLTDRNGHFGRKPTKSSVMIEIISVNVV